MPNQSLYFVIYAKSKDLLFSTLPKVKNSSHTKNRELKIYSGRPGNNFTDLSNTFETHLFRIL